MISTKNDNLMLKIIITKKQSLFLKNKKENQRQIFQKLFK